MKRVLDGIEPLKVFFYFEEICNIPHVSHHTSEMSDYIENFAKRKGFKYIRDEIGNVIVFKNASKGYENHGAVIMQGHIDMVGAKRPEISHDFLTEPIELDEDAISQGYISAVGTSLGGDDGIAVAYMLAILDDDTLNHPALEAVFTVDEEVGLLGATALDCSPLKGKILLNMDSEDEGIFITGSAGGMGSELSLSVQYNDVEGLLVNLSICNLTGGHSGVEIGTGKPSANVCIGRVLYRIGKEVSYRLTNICGGEVDNAISAKCIASIVIDAVDFDKVKRICKDVENELRNEYKGLEDNATVTCEKGMEGIHEAIIKEDGDKIVFILRNAPYGVLARNTDNAELVETSLNPGVLRIENKVFRLVYSVRSSIESKKRDVAERLSHLIGFVGGEYKESGSYPAWTYNPDSEIRKVAGDAYKELFGKEAAFETIHAGLECGIFYDKIPGLDIVSYGPDMEDIHTFDERLKIDSVKRVYDLTIRILEKL